MKKLFKILAVLSLSVAAFAQEDGNRDANGKIVRGPYETNNFWDNWGSVLPVVSISSVTAM